VHLKEYKRKSLLTSSESIDAFLKELEMVHNLRHPNLLMYMGLSIDPERSDAYIVTEFFSTVTLFDVIHQLS
jgi:serine/threonine protein kinase